MPELQQALLDLFNQECEFDNFIPLNNEAMFESLRNRINQFTHIFGEHNTGKTHLLKSWVNQANKLSNNAIYLTIDDLKAFSIYDIDLDTYKYIAIDNIDCADEETQDSIFKLFNLIKLNNFDNALLTSSKENLNHSNIREDLKTRIHSGVVFHLNNPSDDMLIDAATSYANKIGLRIDNAETKYLINHTNRNLGEIISLLHKISDYSITHKKNLSIPTIKQAISL